MATMRELAAVGQSVWLDYIQRSLITSGELQQLIASGLRGITANPTILEKAIDESDDYHSAISQLVKQGLSAEGIYEVLAVEDIGSAADLLRPVYDSTEGADGFVSLEVSPELADDTAGTVEAARHLFRRLDRPNVFIKVPATAAGLPAIEQLLAEGININITLMFSMAQYAAVAEAYLSALEQRVAQGQQVSSVASVASFFVSRIDTLADAALEKIGHQELQGKIAIATAKLVYARFREVFAGGRWDQLKAKGARLQRPLWASTSTKNPAYPDTLYVDSLIGPDTVNTLPPATLKAFLDHGQARVTLTEGVEEARRQLARLAELGVDLGAITDQLLVDGVAAFARSFQTLLASIGSKRDRLLSGAGAAS
jgi:transaldolase